jgi:hypothetical protein
MRRSFLRILELKRAMRSWREKIIERLHAGGPRDQSFCLSRPAFQLHRQSSIAVNSFQQAQSRRRNRVAIFDRHCRNKTNTRSARLRRLFRRIEASSPEVTVCRFAAQHFFLRQSQRSASTRLRGCCPSARTSAQSNLLASSRSV